MSKSPAEISRLIKAKAQSFDFAYCGISEAGFLEEEAPRLEAWLNANQHGEMAYMANHFDKRLDPRKLVDGCQTVVSLVYNYFPAAEIAVQDFKISKYA